MTLLLPAYAKQAQPPNGQPQMPRGQKHESRHEIERLEEAWRNALLQGNATALEPLLADDFMAITPSGTLQTKDQMLANVRAGKVHLTALDFSDRKFRFYGSTALVTVLAAISGANSEGNPIDGNYRYTHVYTRDAKGKWRIVNFEASRVRESGERK
jgi:ketosteroid isomerase-like protein